MTNAQDLASCELCAGPGGVLVAQTHRLRVVQVQDARFPAFFRVIWQAHRAEFTDLDVADQSHMMAVVALVERCMRRHLRPDKINLASLGNSVPHLHWHVVARFVWDTHFPQPIWAVAQRPDPVNSPQAKAVLASLPQVVADIGAALSQGDQHLQEA